MYCQYYFQALPEETTAALYLNSQELGGSCCSTAVYPQPSAVMSCFSNYQTRTATAVAQNKAEEQLSSSWAAGATAAAVGAAEAAGAAAEAGAGGKQQQEQKEQQHPGCLDTSSYSW